MMIGLLVMAGAGPPSTPFAHATEKAWMPTCVGMTGAAAAAGPPLIIGVHE